jgi:diguanylate cyclase (GGDEF)-like protein
MEQITTKEMFEHIQNISNLYLQGQLTPDQYRREMDRMKRIAEDIDKEKRDDKRKILEIEIKLVNAYRDPLMGIFVRRVLEETELSKEIPTDTSFVMCDVDDFGEINEKYGHIIADKILEIIGAKTREVITRSSDLVIRYGGDEIAIILPNCPPEKAAEKCAEIRGLIVESVREKTFNGVSIEEPITLSFGIYHRNNEDISVEESMNFADAAVYHTKEHSKGINKSGISIYTPDMPAIRKKG